MILIYLSEQSKSLHMQTDEPFGHERIIRPYQECYEAEVIGVWHQSGLAAYPYLPTRQAPLHCYLNHSKKR
jgi:hypothetical protein